jgi:hypothetical protein
MEQLLDILQSNDTVTISLEGIGSQSFPTREVYETIRPFVDKQVKSKPIDTQTFKSLGICPSCRKKISIRTAQHYCSQCGQAIDWNVENAIIGIDMADGQDSTGYIINLQGKRPTDAIIRDVQADAVREIARRINRDGHT